jgi:hypothetical protein
MSLFDLKTLAIKDSAFCQLKHPATDELLFLDEEKTQPVGVDVYSTSSKEYRNALTAMQNRSLKRGKKQVSAEVMREEGIDLLVACSIKGVNTESLGDLSNDAAFRTLYNDARFSWVKDQVDAFLGDVSSFLTV